MTYIHKVRCACGRLRWADELCECRLKLDLEALVRTFGIPAVRQQLTDLAKTPGE